MKFKTKERLKKSLIVFGSLSGIGFSILIYWIFLAAWFNNMVALVPINNNGEASVEFIMFPIVIIVNIISTLFLIKYLEGHPNQSKNEIKERERRG